MSRKCGDICAVKWQSDEHDRQQGRRIKTGESTHLWPSVASDFLFLNKLQTLVGTHTDTRINSTSVRLEHNKQKKNAFVLTHRHPEEWRLWNTNTGSTQRTVWLSFWGSLSHTNERHISTTPIHWQNNPHICSAGDWEEINLLLLWPHKHVKMNARTCILLLKTVPTYKCAESNQFSDVRHQTCRDQLSIIGRWAACFHRHMLHHRLRVTQNTRWNKTVNSTDQENY